jgi:hypothetical protein
VSRVPRARPLASCPPRRRRRARALTTRPLFHQLYISIYIPPPLVLSGHAASLTPY